MTTHPDPESPVTDAEFKRMLIGFADERPRMFLRGIVHGALAVGGGLIIAAMVYGLCKVESIL